MYGKYYYPLVAEKLMSIIYIQWNPDFMFFTGPAIKKRTNRENVKSGSDRETLQEYKYKNKLTSTILFFKILLFLIVSSF